MLGAVARLGIEVAMQPRIEFLSKETPNVSCESGWNVLGYAAKSVLMDANDPPSIV